MHNFDLTTDRSKTLSLKYNKAAFGKPADVIPMWVADMDFTVAPAITQALQDCAQGALFGYEDIDTPYLLTLCNWYKKRFSWNVLPGWVVKAPGVIFAYSAALRALTQPGDAVLIFQPVYHPFASNIQQNNRKLIVNELKFNGLKYEMDFESFEQDIIKNNVKAVLFCSPHNPVSRVWSGEELKKFADICLKYNVYIISDEIHSDLVFKPHRHTVIANLNDDIANITVTCTAPTKTFNLAGLQAAHIFVKNPEVKKAIEAEMLRLGYGHLNTMGMVAAKAAYEHGEPWLEDLLTYLARNIDTLKKGLADINCGINLVNPEGTYLMWLDCRELGFNEEELADLFTNKAKLWLNRGAQFGAGGNGFMRMNIATQHSVIEQALNNLRQAAKALK